MSSGLLHIPCDVQQIDDTGYVWTFLDRAAAPERILPGKLVISGDDGAPVVARVIDLVAMTATELGQPDAVGFDQARTNLIGFFKKLAHARITARRFEINLDDGFGRGFEAHADGVKAE